MFNPVWWLVMKHKLTGKLFLSHFTCLHFPLQSSEPSLVLCTSEARLWLESQRVWLRSPWLNLCSVPLLSKEFHGSLSKAGSFLHFGIRVLMGTEWTQKGKKQNETKTRPTARLHLCLYFFSDLLVEYIMPILIYSEPGLRSYYSSSVKMDPLLS